MKGRSASVTCFMGMSLMLLLSVFFTLLEMMHYYTLQRMEPLISQISTESAFGDFNRLLWKDYGVLAIDGSYGTGVFDTGKVTDRMMAYMQDNAGITPAKQASHGVSLLRMSSGSIDIAEYGLLTDHHGVPFMQLAAKEELYETTGNVLGLLKDDAEEMNRNAKEQPNVGDILSDATGAISEAKEQAIAEEEFGLSETWLPDENMEEYGNPIETASEAMEGSWLEMAIPAGRSVSDKTMAGGERVSKRTLAVGTAPSDSSLSIDEKLLYLKFLIDHYSGFAHPKDHGGLQYELEYMVGGKTTDRANLSAVVERLMVIREAANYAYIMSDKQKMRRAYDLAVMLVGIFCNEALIRAVQMGIVAAWALGESILDVRALLAGKRISPMKSAEEWTLSLSMLSAAFSGKMEAKDCPKGLTYEEYLYGFMVLMSETKLGLRGLDVLEDVMHHTEDYRLVKADQMIYCMSIDYSYEAAPLFLSFVVLLTDRPGGYRFGSRQFMTYNR